MKSIYQRNFRAIAILVSACFFALIILFVYIGRTGLINENRSTMRSSVNEAARLCAILDYNGENLDNSWEIGLYLGTISNSTGNTVFITDTEGVITDCSDSTLICEHIGMTLPDEVLLSLKNTGEADTLLRSSAFDEQQCAFVGTSIISDSGEIIGFAVAFRAMGEMFEAWETFLLLATIVAAALLIAALVVGLFYSKHMAKPLDEIAEASRHFARGDFSMRVHCDEDVSNEMGALIESFNKMADSLESSEKRRTEFIANVSHELRTPMTTIAGFADGILDGTIPESDQKKYLTSIRDETRRLSRLVRGMLDTARAKTRAEDAANRTIFNISELLIQILLSFESRAVSKNLDVDPQLPDNVIMVRADKDGITQVIYNLIDNAVKFASPGSCITLKVYKENGKAYVSVADDGETIPPEDLPFIFDRFHKSDRSRSLDKDGVGLGLALVKSILNSHDEDIAVKSADGHTEFTFSLCVADDS